MSLTTQEKFERAMQHAADIRDLDLVIDRQYSNIGVCTFQRRDSFNSVLSFPFTFEPELARFAPAHDDPGELGPLDEEQPRTGFWRVQGEEMDALVVRVGEVLDGNGCLPIRQPDLTVREEALTQIQHLAYDGSFQLESRSVKGDDALTLARVRLDRINAIAEGMQPDRKWTPIQEDSDGNAVAGGDQELALFDEGRGRKESEAELEGETRGKHELP